MTFSPVAAIEVFTTGLALGALCWHWLVPRLKKQETVQRIPKEWPLTRRALVNSEERRVWLWITKVMFDHQVMVKIPVTRFTTPTLKQDAEHWFKLLNGAYCTFSVCNTQGQVVGCIDVPGSKGLSLSNQTLKHTLLSQCGIQYWVVDPDNLPHLSEIRAAFLGDQENHGAGAAALNTKLKDVAVNLQAAVSKQRSQKYSGSPGGAADFAPSSGISLPPNWEKNSFLAPLDSRGAELGQ